LISPTSRSTGRITVVIVFAKEQAQKQRQPRRQLTTALDISKRIYQLNMLN